MEQRPNLVLTRQIGESILIGDDVEITVLEIRSRGEIKSRGKVRLGIKAPKHVEVDRKEVRLQKEEERNA